jgi:hypothetical protein
VCGPLKNFMDEFSLLSFEKNRRKKIHIKNWICKTIYHKHDDIQSLTQLATIQCGGWLAKTLNCLLKNYIVQIYLENMDCIIDHMYVACIQIV